MEKSVRYSHATCSSDDLRRDGLGPTTTAPSMVVLILVTAALSLQPPARPPVATGRRHLLATGAAVALSGRHAPPVAAFTEEDYLAAPLDITNAVLPAFTQRDVYLHIHGRGGPDREDAECGPIRDRSRFSATAA